MGFCCGASDVQVLPKNASSSSSSSSVNSSEDGSKKKKQPEQGKHHAVKQGEVKTKKRSNLDRAALTTPHFPFHSRPGLM